MSRRTRSTAPRALLIAVALLALFGFSMSRASVAIAQEASPVAGECDAPALPPGSPTPMDEASPVAEHDMSAMEGAASPVAEAAAPEGTPADEATTDAATAAVMNIVNCLNGGNYEATVALFTTNGLMSIFGTDNPYDVLAGGFLEGTVFTDVQISDVETYADGRISAQVDYFQSRYQAVSETWWLVEEEGYWKLDGFETLTPAPEGDTAVVGVTMGGPDDEYAFIPNVSSIVQPEVLMLHGINAGVEPHEIVVFRFPEDVTTETVIAAIEAEDESIFETGEFIGASFFEPGQQGDMALVGLEPGVYTLVCFIPAPDGVPHAVKGMVTQITITAPEPVEPVASPAA
ncbi:MAG: hypothetical protein ACRDJW_16250 [Thermomicrobiales bacterium]